jgi:signal transduction histidine kinase
MRSTTAYEEIVGSLVHDLRQPLGNIETSVFYLDLVLDHPHGRVRDQLRTIEHQVAQAAGLLQQATEELRRLRAQRGAESLDLTKSATASVT